MNVYDRRFETVTAIEIKIGDEKVVHNFGRKVSMSHARKWALHYLNVFTGEPSDFIATDGSGDGGEAR